MKLIKGSPVRAVYMADVVHIASFYYKGERQYITLKHLRFEFRGIISQNNKFYRMPNLEKCESISYSILDEDKEILEKCFGDSKIKEIISKRINGAECGNAIDNVIQAKDILDNHIKYDSNSLYMKNKCAFGPLGEKIKFAFIDSDFYRDSYVLDIYKMIPDKEIEVYCEDYLSGQQELDFG